MGYLCLVAAHPPKPIVATYSEHMIGLEMGHDDLMVTDELFQDDEYDDHTYHNEYGPGGWNSIMMADDDNKHNWKYESWKQSTVGKKKDHEEWQDQAWHRDLAQGHCCGHALKTGK